MPWKTETLALHAGQEPDPATGSRAVPIHQTSSYVFRDAEHAANLFALKELGNIYTRLMNPTTDVFERRMAALEGGTAALALSSGMAAETAALLCAVETGYEIVAATSLYGGTRTLLQHTLPKMGIRTVFVDPRDPENFRAGLTGRTRAIYAESVGNPKLDTLDLAAVAAIAREAGVPFIVDNTMPTAFLLKPLEHGADVVVASATKFIGGHGTSIGGVIVDGGTFDWGNGRFPHFTEPDPSYHGLRAWDTFRDFAGMGNVTFAMKLRLQWLRDTGACASPFNSFLFLQGLETLPLRMERHSENALAVARFLETHPKVAWVSYPGLPTHPSHDLARRYHHRGLFGAIVGFGIAGGAAAGSAFIDRLGLFSHLANIGDAKSLAIHPASTTHQQLGAEEQLAAGVTPEFVRLSVGLEHSDDLLEDLDQALNGG
ncbi:MAG: PLP-dependent transferase [Deferrisomatales bacterium]|nr:PLP-dependent transferase [Deferrisomatales bacterium]